MTSLFTELPPLPVPKGWREDWVECLDGKQRCRAVDPCGLIWLPMEYESGTRWELYVVSFGYARTEGRREWRECDVAHESGKTTACPIAHGTVTLPDGRKVTEGNWHH